MPYSMPHCTYWAEIFMTDGALSTLKLPNIPFVLHHDIRLHILVGHWSVHRGLSLYAFSQKSKISFLK